MAIDLGALVVRIETQLAKAFADISKFEKQFLTMSAKIQGSMKANAAAMTRFGRQLTFRLTLPLIGLGAAALKSGADIEEAFIGVQKTVDATEEEFAKLRSGFDDMAKSTPIAITQLLKLGEVAGQLGIETENILGFSETMAQLGVTTDMSAEQAASSLARLANITQLPQENFDRLGATIVELGNNLATTESEIVDMGLRLAGAGETIGLTEAQILSFAAAMTSLGIRAESGGSAFSRVMLEMNTAVLSGKKELLLFARVAGKTTSDFARLFREDASEALALFVEGLAKIRQEGGDVTETLEDLGLQNIRITDVFNRLSGSGGLLRQSLRLGGDAWRKNTALVEEAEKKYDSFKSKLVILKNNIDLAGEAFSVILIPIFEKLVDKLITLFDWLDKSSDGTKKLILVIGGLAAVVGPALITIGTLAGLIGTVGIAAIGTATSLGVLLAAIVAIKNAPAIGQFFHDEFKIVQQVAANFLLNTMTIWEAVKFGFKQMVAGMRFAWDSVINDMKSSLSTLVTAMAVLSKSPALKKFSESLTASMSSVGKDMFAANKKEFDKRMRELQETSNAIFLDIDKNFEEKEKAKVDAAKETQGLIDDIRKSGGGDTPGNKFFDFDIEDFNTRVLGWVTASRDLGNNIADAFTRGLDAISNGITDLLFNAEADFNAIMESIFKQITAAIIKSAIATAVSGIPGLGGGGDKGEKQLLAATMNQASAGLNETAALGNQIAGSTMVAASAAMNAAAAQMVTAATINAGASAGGGASGFAQGGIVQPVFAANGFTSRGTDTVPAMLTPGEMVIPKSETEALLNGGGQGGNTTIFNVSAIDASGVSQFFKRNKNQIANALGSTRSQNNKNSRRRG